MGFKLVRVSGRSDTGYLVISRNPPAFRFITESWLSQESHWSHLTCWQLVFSLFFLPRPHVLLHRLPGLRSDLISRSRVPLLCSSTSLPAPPRIAVHTVQADEFISILSYMHLSEHGGRGGGGGGYSLFVVVIMLWSCTSTGREPAYCTSLPPFPNACCTVRAEPVPTSGSPHEPSALRLFLLPLPPCGRGSRHLILHWVGRGHLCFPRPVG